MCDPVMMGPPTNMEIFPSEGLSGLASDRGVKRKQRMKEGCPFNSCNPLDQRPRRHVTAHHMPKALQYQPESMSHEDIEATMRAIYWLVGEALCENVSLQDAVDYINSTNEIADTKQLHPCYDRLFEVACGILGCKPPKNFELHPINSPAILLFWRCTVVLLNNCAVGGKRQFV